MKTIIHIGAGEGIELDQWLGGDTRAIVLVEPNPGLAERLRTKTRDEPRVTVVEAAVTTDPANNQLQEYNLPEAASLRPVTGLKALFPGLKATDVHSVATISPEQLLADHGPQPGESAMLILQAAGEELAILQALIHADQLRQFRHLHLAAAPEPYYEGSASAEQILERLIDYGYDITAENQQDPDWPQWQLARNPLKDQISELQTENAQLKAERQTLHDQLQQQAAEKEQNRAELEAKTRHHSELQTCLAELQQQLQAAETALSAKNKAEQQALQQLEQVNQQLAEHQQMQAQRQAELTAAAEKQQRLERELAEKDIQHSNLTRNLADVQRQLKDAEAAFSAKVQCEQQTSKQLAQAKQQLADVRKALAQKQADLVTAAEKQQNLEADVTERNKQISTLTARLTELQQKLQDTEAAFESKAQADQKTIATFEQRSAQIEEQCSLALENLQQVNHAKVVLEQELVKAREELEAEQHAHQQTAKLLDDHKEWFQARKKQAENQLLELANLKQENEQLQRQLESKNLTLEQLKKEYCRATDKLQEQLTTNARLDELQKQIAGLGSSMTSQFDKKFTNAAKQIESTLGVQNYLNTGELPLSYHGWPISPDLALYLTEKLETENYDLIIEFGSGTSTLLFAKVLMKKALRLQKDAQHKLTNKTESLQGNQQWLGRSEPDEADLPKRVLAFEHNKNYYEQTSSMLRQANLDHVVSLVHAPLVDYSYKGKDFLYYDCEKTLSKIAELYEGREPKVLALVDGPPGITGPNARFPALPVLLSHLPKAKLVIVLDDFNRKEEKEVSAHWLELLAKRFVDFEERDLPLEKGGFEIIIN